MFLVNVRCGNGHRWDVDADQSADRSRDQFRPCCPVCGEVTTGPVDPPDITVKFQLRRTGSDIAHSPVIRIR